MVSEGICRERESNVFAHISQDLTQHTKAGDASDERNSAAEIFFSFRVRKRKTPNQYAEIINVCANESLNQGNNENKRNKK